MKARFPDGLDYAIALDTNEFVRRSIKEVVKTLLEAIVLVILVVFLFLQSFRTTIICRSLAVPVSIIATFVGMLALGFSINLLTLFGLVLAIGMVVDDAIVVVENVERNMSEFHLDPKEAAKKAMDEISGLAGRDRAGDVRGVHSGRVPVRHHRAALQAVRDHDRGVGRRFRLRRADALAGARGDPAQAGEHKKNRFFNWFNETFDRFTGRYGSAVQWAIRRVAISGLIILGVLVITGGLFKSIPSSFLPTEDQGYLLGAVILPDASSLDRTSDLSKRAEDWFAKQPGVSSVSAGVGFSLIDSQYVAKSGTLFVALKGFHDRGEGQSAAELIHAGMKEFSQYKEGLVVPVNPPSIPGLGTTGGFEFWLQSTGDASYAMLEQKVQAFLAKARQRPELRGVNSTINSHSRQLLVDVDRERAESLGVAVQDVYQALQVMFGSLYVSQFPKSSRLFQVILQAEPQDRMRPEDLQHIYVRNKSGAMVPLKAVTTTRYVPGADIVTRFNNFPAAKITGDAAPGYSSGQAIAAMEDTARQVLDNNYHYAWCGQAYEEKKAGSTALAVFAFALLIVFLILAAQYEKWSLPLGVLMAVPFALFGALVGILLRGIENDVYFQIGLTVLIALAAKNAILIFEFAVELREKEGLGPYEAALHAAKLRLRPIIMTSLAFILGCVPLAIASGASAASRRSLGTGVVFGMLGCSTIALIFIPMFFWGLETMSGRKKEKPAAASESPPDPAKDAAPLREGH